jgi:hypothetical protein
MKVPTSLTCFAAVALLAPVPFLAAALGCHAASVKQAPAEAAAVTGPPAADVRIAWDFRSRQTLAGFTVDGKTFNQRHYPRVKRLKSGDLLMTFMDGRFGWQIFTQRSKDGGKTWSAPRWLKKSWYDAAAKDSVAYCNPEFLQLRDGSLLLAYQRRNNRRSNENEGIEVMRSTDEGETWSAPEWAFRGKNWEPSLLQLPSGEVQLLFTATYDNQCHVGMVRSLDGGRTWRPAPDVKKPEAEYLSRTEGATPEGTPFSMDGMAVGTALQNGKGIVYVAECDLVRKKITPMPVTPFVVWSSLERNWRYPEFKSPMPGPSDRRWPVHPDFTGYAPYLTQLDTGEVLVQANGRFRGTGGMWTFIGDPTARRFGSPSRPFGVLGFWGCISQIAPNRVISGATTGAKDSERILLVQGVLNRPLIVGKTAGEGNEWFIGGVFQAQGRLSASGDGTNLTLRFVAKDEQVIASEPARSDGFRLSWKAAGDSNPMFRLTATAGGSAWLESRRKSSDSWAKVKGAAPMAKAERDGSGYHLTVTVPWTLLGRRPAAGEVNTAHLELRNVDSAADQATDEGMPGENSDDPATWLPVRLK